MRRVLYLIAALAAAFTFSATAPTVAVAGLRMVASAAPAAAAEACARDEAQSTRLVVVTCKKKALHAPAAPCPSMQAILPVLPAGDRTCEAGVAPPAAPFAMAEIWPDEVLRPPRPWASCTPWPAPGRSGPALSCLHRTGV